MPKPYKITPAIFPRDRQAVASLFTAYTNALGIDLTFQDYETELSSLPGKYAVSQGGYLLVARVWNEKSENKEEETLSGGEDVQLLGCIAYRALPPSLHTLEEPNNSKLAGSHDDNGGSGKGYCEMKRLYLTPEARGSGIGTQLIAAAIQHARSTQLYRGMKLDTLPFMESARALYKRYGFVEVERYYETPLEGTIFMGLEF